MDRNGGTSEATGTQFIEKKELEFPSFAEGNSLSVAVIHLCSPLIPPKKTLENLASSTVDPRVFSGRIR